MPHVSLLIASLFLFAAVRCQLCEDAFSIERDGEEFLRLNGTNDFWACSQKNLCNKTSDLDTRISALEALPVFSARRNRSLSIGAGVETAVHFETAGIDTTNSYDPTLGVYRVPVSGYYHIQSTLTVQTAVAGTLHRLSISRDRLCADAPEIISSCLNHGRSVNDYIILTTQNIVLLQKDQIVTVCAYGTAVSSAPAGRLTQNWFMVYKVSDPS